MHECSNDNGIFMTIKGTGGEINCAYDVRSTNAECQRDLKKTTEQKCGKSDHVMLNYTLRT
jgi:hypothetical protein